MQNFSDPQNFENYFLRRPPNTLGIGIVTLWYAIGIYFGILNSHAKFFGPANFWKRFHTAPTKHLRDRDTDPLVCKKSLLRNSKFACKNFRFRKFLKTISHGASPNTLGIGMGALWYAIGIHFEILNSHAKFFGPAKFWKRFSTAPTKHLRDRDRDPLVCDRNLLRSSKIACKNFRFRKF